MLNWILKQIDISDELIKFSTLYMILSGAVMAMAFAGLYLHSNEQDNHLLGIATVLTVVMSLYERYKIKALKSANLTLASAVIYSLMMT